VEVDGQWIHPMVDLLESNASIGACQPKVLSFSEKDSFEYAGAAGGWIDALGYPFSRGRVFDVCEKDLGQYNQSSPIFWATGAAMMIRSSLFHQLNGFDDSFFAHQEEIDLCWRMQLLGFHLYACPNAKVYHVGAGTLPRGGRKVFLNFRNNLIMLTKNLPLQELVWKIPFRFALDAISAWKGLFSGDFSFFRAIVAAHFGYFSHILTGKLKRSKSPKPMKSLDGVYNGSLVWDYFIKNKQHFNKIVL
jgi:GT2 family glycosyltransferase